MMYNGPQIPRDSFGFRKKNTLKFEYLFHFLQSATESLIYRHHTYTYSKIIRYRKAEALTFSRQNVKLKVSNKRQVVLKPNRIDFKRVNDRKHRYPLMASITFLCPNIMSILLLLNICKSLSKHPSVVSGLAVYIEDTLVELKKKKTKIKKVTCQSLGRGGQNVSEFKFYRFFTKRKPNSSLKLI